MTDSLMRYIEGGPPRAASSCMPYWSHRTVAELTEAAKRNRCFIKPLD